MSPCGVQELAGSLQLRCQFALDGDQLRRRLEAAIGGSTRRWITLNFFVRCHLCHFF
jgi:hypothetical protein